MVLSYISVTRLAVSIPLRKVSELHGDAGRLRPRRVSIPLRKVSEQHDPRRKRVGVRVSIPLRKVSEDQVLHVLGKPVLGFHPSKEGF